MSTATGLGMLDVAILEACERAGAGSGRPFVTTRTVLGALLDDTGIGPRTAYEPLCDLARRWTVHLRLIEFHGNLGSPLGYGPASPRYTECRLTPLGSAALASERGELGPLPIGLINGNTHVGGGRPPLDPHRTLAAVSAASSATDDALLAIIGGPSFPTGCRVEIDIEAWAVGAPADAALTARIEPDAAGRLVISHLPPDCTANEVVMAIQSHMDESGRAPRGDADLGVGALRRPAPLIRDVSDLSGNDEVRIVLDLLPGANIDEARRFVSTLWGVRRTLDVHVGVPTADLVRGFTEHTPGTLGERLVIIEAAIES